MRYLYAALFFLTLINFSGLPDLIAGIMGDEYAICSIIDEQAKEDPEEKGKEDTKEKEDLKEAMLTTDCLPGTPIHAIHLSSRNLQMGDSGFVPEDHCPPPEFI